MTGLPDGKLLPGLKVAAVGLKEKDEAFGFRPNFAAGLGGTAGCFGGVISAWSSHESAMREHNVQARPC